MLYIFPDTNIFLHGKDFEEIDWSAWLKQKDVTIMMAPVVISELDEHKRNRNQKIAAKARKLLPRLEAIVEGDKPSNINVQLVLKTPGEKTFEQHSLDRKINDNQLLASVIEFISRLSTENSVVLITNDSGPRFKARALGITVAKLPDEYLLPMEPDENEKKLAAVQAELLQLKTKIPELNVCFSDGKTFQAIKKPSSIISKNEYVSREITKIKAEFKPLSFTEEKTMLFPSGTVKLPSFGPSDSQVTRYNQQLEKYYDTCAAHFTTTYNFVDFRSNCVKVLILVKNTGTVPATDIDIDLHFPDGFTVITEQDFPQIEDKPEPPYQPKHLGDIGPFGSFLGRVSPSIARQYKSADFAGINSNVSSPKITKTNSHNVIVHIKSIKHNQFAKLDALYLKYPDIRNAKGFTIDYKVMAANVPKLLEGKLQVKFENNNA